MKIISLVKFPLHLWDTSLGQLGVRKGTKKGELHAVMPRYTGFHIPPSK